MPPRAKKKEVGTSLVAWELASPSGKSKLLEKLRKFTDLDRRRYTLVNGLVASHSSLRRNINIISLSESTACRKCGLGKYTSFMTTFS
jgi:hypothetical protein